MPITLIVEDGSSKVDANTYASRAQGDDYADARLRANDWTGASGGDKDKALAMATRIIDQEFQFNGFKTTQEQALQWPRRECPDPDYEAATMPALSFRADTFLPSDEVPAVVVQVTCEMAIQLLKAERTGDPQGQGIKRVDIAGAVEVEFDTRAGAKPLLLTRDVLNALARLGTPVGGSSRSLRVVRT